MSELLFRAADGVELNGYHWPTTDAPRGNVIILHGYGHHGGSFADVAAALNAHGYAVLALDQRGHGKSPGRRGYIESFDHWVDDTHAFVAHTAAITAGAPVFFMGHSLGCLALGLYVVRHAPPARGLIFSSGLLRIPENVPVVLQKLANIIAAIAPTLPVQPVDVTATSRDPKAVQALRDDPLRYGGMMQARSGAEVAKAIATFQSRMSEITLPILIMHGTKDRLTDFEGSRLLDARVKSTDKTFCAFEGGYHELYNDFDKERWFAQVLTWLDAHA